MKKILLVIHTPPPFGGGEIQAQHIKDFFKYKEEYFIYDYSRKNHSRSNWDKVFDLSAIISGIWWEMKVIYMLFNLRPDKIYFTLPKSFRGFMRNASIIPFAKLVNAKILGELPGTSFLFLDYGKGLRYRTGLFFLRRIDEIRFLSPRIAELHAHYKIRKPVIIENGIKIEKNVFVKYDVFKRPVLDFLYIGSIEKSKGIFNSLNALKLIIAKGHKIHFHIIGYWPNPSEEIEALRFIQQNNLEQTITFHGILDGKSKYEVFRNCAVLIHPTFWDGVPLAILEALAVGLPIITTNVGGIPDTIKDGANGIILTENTPELLCEAIAYYSNNRHILPVISERNKTLFKDRFELSIFLKNMENWFNE